MIDRWYIYDGESESGPWPWSEIVYLVNRRKITRNAFIRREGVPQWAPVAYYFPPHLLPSPDEIGFIPGIWDLVFGIALFVFIIGIFIFMTEPVFGIAFFIISPVFEILAVVQDHKTKIKSSASKLGTLCAGGWIVFQVAVTFFLVAMTMS